MLEERSAATWWPLAMTTLASCKAGVRDHCWIGVDMSGERELTEGSSDPHNHKKPCLETEAEMPLADACL